MHKTEFVLENDMHRLLWGFEIQTDHLISARRPDLITLKKKKKKKKTCRVEDFTVPAYLKVKLKEGEIWDIYLDRARELKKTTLEPENDGDTNCNGCF